MANFFEEFVPSQLSAILKVELPSLSVDVITRFEDSRIDGEAFLSIDDDCLREIAPLLGDRLKLKKLLTAIRAKKCHPVSTVLTSKISSCYRIYHTAERNSRAETCDNL